MTILTQDLTRAFERVTPHKIAVDHVNLEIAPGTVYGLIGPNGAGKSTLIALLATLLTPSSGNAIVNGHDISRNPASVRASIALSFGGERSFYNRLTLYDNMEFFGALHGIGRRETRTRVQSALERVGLWGERAKYVNECSSGMKRRLNFARALVVDAPVFLCDEPTTGVDVESAYKLRGLIRDLKNDGRTVVLVSHNLEEVGELADRVGLMANGSLLHEDTPMGFRRRISARAVNVEFCGDSDRIDALLEELQCMEQIQDIQYANSCALITTSAAELVVSDVMKVLHERAIPVTSVGVVRPTLETVFRELVQSAGEAVAS